ncbi:hypothetical protein GCM10009573_04250 [Agromyces bracchium]
MSASAIHEIQTVPGTAFAFDIAAFRGRPAAASAALIAEPPRSGSTASWPTPPSRSAYAKCIDAPAGKIGTKGR